MHRHSAWACLLLLIGLCQPARSQELLGTVQDLRMSRFDQNTGTLIRVYDDHYFFSGVTGDSAINHPAPGIGELLRDHNIHLLKGELILVRKGSGPVYAYREGTLQRIDFSLDHRYQQDAVEFIYRDTLFRHGGYAMYEARNHLTYFSPVTNEWEIVQPVFGPDLPPGLFRHLAILTGSDLYLYGGYTVNPYNPLEHAFNKEVWKFSLRDYRWTRLGTIAPELNGISQLQHNPGWFTGQEWFRLHEAGIGFLNPALNQVRTGPKPTTLNTAADYGIMEYFPWKGHLYYYSAGKIYDASNTLNGMVQKLDYMRLPLADLQRSMPKSVPFHHQETGTLWWLLLLLPVAGIIPIFWGRKATTLRDDSRAVIATDHILYKGVEYPLQPAAIAVLSLLLAEPEDVPSSELMKLTSNPSLDYPNQVRQKNQVIRSINLELRSILRTGTDVISQTESPADRRIKCYRIDRSWFNQPTDISS